MSRSEIAPELSKPELRKKVANLKDADFKWRKRMTWSLGLWFIPGIIAGVGTWFSQRPINRDEIMLGGVLGLGFAVWFFGCCGLAMNDVRDVDSARSN